VPADDEQFGFAATSVLEPFITVLAPNCRSAVFGIRAQRVQCARGMNGDENEISLDDFERIAI
jgi:hypothetical protein